MSLQVQETFTQNTQVDQKATLALNPYFFGVKPSKSFFEAYGISGCSKVMTDGGLTKIASIGFADELMTRNSGFACPIGVLQSTEPTGSVDAPTSLTVNSEFFRDSLPFGNVIVGRHAEIHVPITRMDKYRQKKATSDLTAFCSKFSNSHGKQTRLFVPIFAEQTAIQVEGIYVVCPGLDDLARSLDKTKTWSGVH